MFLVLKWKWGNDEWEIVGMTDTEEIAQEALEFEVEQEFDQAFDKMQSRTTRTEKDGVVRITDSRGDKGRSWGLWAAFTIKRIDLPEDPSI